MDIALGTNLTLPLFLLDETLQNRDPEKPDFSIDIILDEDLVAHMCQARKLIAVLLFISINMN